MPNFTNQNELRNHIRTRFPQRTKSQTDKEVYDDFAAIRKEYFNETHPMYTAPKIPQIRPDEELDDVDISPDGDKSLQDQFISGTLAGGAELGMSVF